VGQLRREPATVSSEIRTTPSERPARWRQAGDVRRGQAANHGPAVAVRTITGVSVQTAVMSIKKTNRKKNQKKQRSRASKKFARKERLAAGEKTTAKSKIAKSKPAKNKVSRNKQIVRFIGVRL